MVKLGAMKNSVCPSAGARNTCSAPITVLAPGRLSMITLCPSALPSDGATARPTVSVVPPGGNGTTMRTAFEGNSCAPAAPAASNRASAGSTSNVLIRIPPPSRSTTRRYRPAHIIPASAVLAASDGGKPRNRGGGVLLLFCLGLLTVHEEPDEEADDHADKGEAEEDDVND